jgi:hypothetical protein
MSPEHSGERGRPKNLADKGHRPPAHKGEVARLDEIPEHAQVRPIVIARNVESLSPKSQRRRQHKTGHKYYADDGDVGRSW